MQRTVTGNGAIRRQIDEMVMMSDLPEQMKQVMIDNKRMIKKIAIL